MKLFLLAMIVATPCAAAHQFDLVCKGTRTYRNPLTPKPLTTPYSAELRIDLDRERYCYGACQRTRPIAAPGEKPLLLAKSNAPDDPQLPREDTSIDLATGRLVSEITAIAPDRSRSSVAAICSSGPFKPFPAGDTQF